MAEYLNPAAGLPEANFANNPFWSGVKSVERQQTMQPFMDMAQQRQQMELQKQGVLNQEFMSPEARGARMGAFGEAAAKSKFNAEKARADLEMLPMEQKKRVAEISEAIRSAEAKPMQELFTEMAGISDVLERTPEQHRPMVYKQWADRTQQKIGKPLPQQYQEYTPQFLNEAKNIKYGLVYTPKLEQEKIIKGVEGENRLAEQRLQNQGSANVAEINQRGAMARQQYATKEGRPVNPAQRIVQLRKVLSSPDAPAEEKEVAKEEMLTYLTDGFQKMISSDPMLKSLAGMAGIPGPQGDAAKQRYEQAVSQKWQGYLQQQGMGGQGKPGLSDQGQDAQKAVQAFGAYEPDKYEYGINPNTGNFGRKPKGK